MVKSNIKLKEIVKEAEKVKGKKKAKEHHKKIVIK